MPTTDRKSVHNGAAVQDRPGFARDTKPSASLSPKIWRVVGYLEQCFAQPLTLHRVATIVGLHPDYLSRRFKRENGVGFHEYLLTIRLRRATSLLVTSTTSIKEISYDVGFRSPEVFSKAFKRFVGCSPVTYRLHNLPLYDHGTAQSPWHPAAPTRTMGHGDHVDFFDRVVECWEDA
jgi:two-component system response regulator YesN